MTTKVSKTQQILDEANKLLSQDWLLEDRELVTRLVGNLKFYKSFIPGGLKEDICSILEMANRIKCDYEVLLIKSQENQDNQNYQASQK
jgi:hypothetical protein